MKKFAFILLSFLVAFPAFSQVKFGLKGGLSTTTLKMEDLKTLTTGDTEYTVDVLEGANYGFHGVAFVRFSMMGFYIQT